MERTTESIGDFLANNDPDGSLAAIDAVLTDALPDATRHMWRGAMWGGTEQAIIGYGDIVQPRPRGKSVEWFLIGLARQKDYISLYVNAAEGRTYLAKDYGPRLGKTKVGSASISFRAVEDIDLDLVGEMARHAGRIQPYS